MSSYSTSNSASSSCSISSQEERSGRKPPQGYRAALHSVRKSVITKKPIAPMPPVPPKIYKVDPADFRDVVQWLTAGPEFQRRSLQEVAPPPLRLSPPPAMSPLGFSLSPASMTWCSSMLLSPQTLAAPLEPSAVL